MVNGEDLTAWLLLFVWSVCFGLRFVILGGLRYAFRGESGL